MARKSVEYRNRKREKMATACLKHTLELRKKSKLEGEDGDKARLTLNKRPRNKSMVRVRNRCSSCSRSRGVMQKFGLCRICIRLSMMRGYIPGMKKASW